MVSASRRGLVVLVACIGCSDQHVEVLKGPVISDAGNPVACVDVDFDTGRVFATVGVAASDSGALAVGLESAGADFSVVSMHVADGGLHLGARLENAELSLIGAVASGDQFGVAYYANSRPMLVRFSPSAQLLEPPMQVPTSTTGSAAWGLRISAAGALLAVVYRTLAATLEFTTWANGAMLVGSDQASAGEVDGLVVDQSIVVLTQNPNVQPDRLEVQRFSLDGGVINGRTTLARGLFGGRPFACRSVALFGRATDAGFGLEGVPFESGAAFKVGLTSGQSPRLLSGECRGTGATVVFRSSPTTLRVVDIEVSGSVTQRFDVAPISLNTDFALALEGSSVWLIARHESTGTTHLIRRCVP